MSLQAYIYNVGNNLITGKKIATLKNNILVLFSLNMATLY